MALDFFKAEGPVLKKYRSSVRGYSHKTAKFPMAPLKPLSTVHLSGKIDFRIQQLCFYNILNINNNITLTKLIFYKKNSI
jgi:hypothetical protein